MANGRVITGYSLPVVAEYTATGTTVSYGDVTALARGVSITVDVETADSNDFYADNVLAESASGTFSGGTATVTVDGQINGADVSIYEYDDRQSAPYVGLGFVVRVMEEGVISYIPYVLPKVLFSADSIEANTQEEEIDWQTTELSASVFRDDSEHHRWRRVGAAQTTEAKASAVIAAMLA